MDLIMHRVTKESGLTDSANGSMAKDTEPLGSTTKGGRHVGLDKMCLLMEVRMVRILVSCFSRPRLSARPPPLLRIYVEVWPVSHCFAQFPGLGRPVKGESVYTSQFNPERRRVGSPQEIMQNKCHHRQGNHPGAGGQVQESVASLARRVLSLAQTRKGVRDGDKGYEYEEYYGEQTVQEAPT